MAGYDSDMESEIVLEETVASDPRVRGLVAEQEAEVMARYHETDPGPGASPDSPAVVAMADDRPVGCVLVSFHRDFAEIKRMYVAPASRGRGLSRLLLERAEVIAAARGAFVLRLETGLAQPEAMALYSRSGYSPIPCYGYWKDDPDVRCYEKSLTS
ncbi:GNAT family N-acetyltransferase [Agromyces luteolus]|uniref:GNAT family N-acetyltransferase n=2 Tax=Agromyces luteolus TaxID=88373 RepID=A0A7C9HJ71_9MICO|nr:GNAT family N-acetyltransferase [Agromyces luteolus]